VHEASAEPSSPEVTKELAPRNYVDRADAASTIFDQAVNFVQQLGQALYRVDYDNLVVGRDLLCETSRLAAEPEVGRTVEQIEDPFVAKLIPDQRRLARLTRPQQKVRLLRQQRAKIEAPFDEPVRRHYRQVGRHMTTRASTVYFLRGESSPALRRVR
jgi:hypothetical protein